MSPRWMKIARDMRLARGRLAMVVVALAASIAAVVTMASAYSVLSREVPANYMRSNPASAQLEIDGMLDAALLALVAARPGIATADLAGTVMARVETTPGTWLPMRIFVVPDFTRARINTASHESGAWPPPTGTLLIERSALPLSKSAVGKTLNVEFRDAGRHKVGLSGVVHDPGLAPAWQEQVLYAYATPATLAQFGAVAQLNLLKIVVAAGANDPLAIERTARALAAWLKPRAIDVHEARIPPPGQHPHQTQMNAVVLMLLLFSLLVLVLGSVLTGAIIGGLLSEQVRQVAIMKSVGARTHQIATMYLGLVGALALLALAAGLPLGLVGGRALVAIVAQLLNLQIASSALPWTLVAASIAIGFAVPMLAALVPIMMASRLTVQAAIQDRGVSRSAAGLWWMQRLVRAIPARDVAFTLALRNMLRRRARLLLTMILLSGAGAMFLTSMNLKAAWEDRVAQAAAERSFDVELRLLEGAPAERALATIDAVAAVRRSEAWSSTRAALPGQGGLTVSRSYPDGGHGSLALRSAPADTTLVARTMLGGRWLASGELHGAVINEQALANIFPSATIGRRISISLDQRPHHFQVVGIVRDILAPATVFVTAPAFAAATGSQNINAVRIKLNDVSQVPEGVAAMTAALGAQQIGVKAVLTEKTFAAAQGGHIYILVYALGFIAAIMAIVGLLGLASSLGTSVLERTREFGVMRAIGASSSVVVRSVVYEGLLIALASSVVAVAAAVLPSKAVGEMLASISSQPLALVLSPSGAALWLACVLIAALAASYFPATRASKLTIKQTLDWEYAA